MATASEAIRPVVEGMMGGGKVDEMKTVEARRGR